MRFKHGTLEAYNIINVLCPAPATGATLAAIASRLQTFWNGTLSTYMSTSISWLGADLTALDAPGAPFLAYTNTGTITGGFGGGLFPPQVTLCISLRTGLSGRSYRGRLYMIGLSSSNVVTDGNITPVAASTFAGVWNALRTGLIAGGFNWCVLSLYSGIDAFGEKIPRATGVATAVTSIVCGTRLDTQRKRLPAEARV